MTQNELDEEFHWGHTAVATPKPPVQEPQGPIRITYEVSGNEPLHPDPAIAARFKEIGLSDCGFGCKVYADPSWTGRVLAHNRTYGCPK